MTVNVDLLRRTLAHIEQHPEQHDQDHYRCETSMCFAGWAVTLAGGRWASDDPNSPWYDRLVAEPADPTGDRTRVGGVVRPFFRARRILGLTETQAEALFLDAEDIGDVRRVVDDLCAGIL